MVGLKYQEYMEKLGFELVVQLMPSSCVIYKALDAGSLITIKFGETPQFPWQYTHVNVESEVLGRVKGVDGIASKISFHELVNEDEHKLVALVKKYIEGKYMKFRDIQLTEPNVLVNAVNALHRSGVAGLDLGRRNIVIDPLGKPWIVDLGYCSFRDGNLGIHNFQNRMKYDLKRLDDLLG